MEAGSLSFGSVEAYLDVQVRVDPGEGPHYNSGSKAVTNGTAKAELERGGLDSERLGRRLGIAVFWLLCCFVIGMSARSIVPSLFWPSLAPRAQARDAVHCAREIAALDGQLQRKTSASLREGDVAASQRWLIAWDRRSMALSGGCGALEQARVDLLELRAGLGALLERYRDGPMQAQQRLRRILDAHSKGVAPRADPKAE